MKKSKYRIAYRGLFENLALYKSFTYMLPCVESVVNRKNQAITGTLAARMCIVSHVVVSRTASMLTHLVTRLIWSSIPSTSC